jgi:phage shock protein PspC (stress-responsive transcriptional regulator)
MIDRKILSVCAWVADKFSIDVGGVRILFVAAAIFDSRSSIIFPLVKPSEY